MCEQSVLSGHMQCDVRRSAISVRLPTALPGSSMWLGDRVSKYVAPTFSDNTLIISKNNPSVHKKNHPPCLQINKSAKGCSNIIVLFADNLFCFTDCSAVLDTCYYYNSVLEDSSKYYKLVDNSMTIEMCQNKLLNISYPLDYSYSKF